MSDHNIVVGTVAIIQDSDGRLLMLKRVKPPLAGRWSLPGGKIEVGESIKTAAEREIFEETDLKLNCARLAASWNEVIKKPDGKLEHFLMFAGLFNAPAGVELKRSAEGELRWFSRPEFEKVKPQAAPSDWDVLNRLAFGDKNKGWRHFEVIIEEQGSDYLMTKLEEQ